MSQAGGYPAHRRPVAGSLLVLLRLLRCLVALLVDHVRVDFLGRSDRVRALITGPQGFERTVVFALDEAPATITERVRETIED
jgi:hypothetical protein